ncbi:MAG: LysM peptidoglycan-binding domain-containing protein [Polyangiaceae bacterium]
MKLRTTALTLGLLLLSAIAGAESSSTRTHVVYDGQRLGSIAKRYGVSVDALCTANEMRPTDSLKPGQRLLIPARNDRDGTRARASATPRDTARQETTRRRNASEPPATHRVEPGQRLDSIARRYGVSVDDLRRANHLAVKSIIRPGQVLKIPDPNAPEGSDASEADSHVYLRAPARKGHLELVGYNERFRGQAIDRKGKLLPTAFDGACRVLAATGSRPRLDSRLVRLLSDVSDAFGGRAVRIVSGYRTTSYFQDSRHKLSKAVDFLHPWRPQSGLARLPAHAEKRRGRLLPELELRPFGRARILRLLGRLRGPRRVTARQATPSQRGRPRARGRSRSRAGGLGRQRRRRAYSPRLTAERSQHRGPLMLPTLASGFLLAGRYRIDSAIGGTEFGAVYAATDETSGRQHAVKVFHPALRGLPSAWSAFQDLERSVATLDARAISRASDFGLDASLGVLFGVSEQIGFPSLGALVATRGALPAAALASAFEVFAESLDAAASKGIAHGDLKPQNLFFSVENPSWARISDFGMAALRGALNAAAGPALGWTSPERLRDGAASPQDDLFALGLLAFYGLTGRHFSRAMWEPAPDPTRVTSELASALTSARAHALSLGASLPATLDAWFSRALSPNPTTRFENAGVATRAFTQALQSEPALPVGVAATVAAPLLFQELPSAESSLRPPPPEPKAMAASASAFTPAEPRISGDLPRSSRPPSVPASRPRPREHVDGMPNAPPIALFAVACGAVLLVAVVGAFAAWRVLTRPSAVAAASASAAAPAVAMLPSAAATPSASEPSRASSAHFSCTPETCEWIVCDGENVKKGVMTLELSPGRHSCSASRYGFRTAVVEFTLETGKTTNVVFELLTSKAKSAPRAAPKAKPKGAPSAKPKH